MTDQPVAGKANFHERENPLAERKVVLRMLDLRKAFGGQVVLDGVSSELREGEVVLLRGDNGSGKTTLLNILSGNLEPDAGSIHLQVNGASEHFKFPRRWWQNLNPFDHFTPERVACEGVGRTWQDVRLFGNLTLADNIAAASPDQLGENPINVLMRYGGTRRSERKNLETASNRLRGLGLSGRENSSADRISLGQTKRVAIARAVQGGARILFLDEPLAGLDAQGIDNVLELLRALVREHRVTLVIVEHVFNIPRILDLADTVWTLQDGKITIESPVVVRDEHSESFDVDIVSWITKQFGQEPTVSKETLPGGAILWKVRRSKSDAGDASHPLLEVRDLVVRRGKRLVIGWEESGKPVRGLSFSIATGEVGIFQAPNGWGKTTLAEAIAGIIPVAQGEVCFRGKPIEQLPSWKRSYIGIGLVQSRNTLFPSLSVDECRKLAGCSGERIGSKYDLKRSVGSLSGGERQQLVLTTAQPKALGIYDEPFSALDHVLLKDSLLGMMALGHHSTLILLPHA